MKCLLIVAFMLATTLLSHAEPATSAPYKNLKFGGEMQRKAVFAAPMLMDTGGAQMVRLGDGTRWLIGVGFTDRRASGATETMRQIKVTRVKAQAAVVEFLNTLVNTQTKVGDTTKSNLDNGQETATSTETIDTKTITEAKGLVSQFEVLGTWTNQDETIFYQAIGKKLK